ncbi:putative peroxidase-related enzyme [Dyadobacter jejuensis]|uniref:Putative peroxidase-related enzyme n=1 Tax=Dyadobacter jejuensis TaxID=1082580 RepID=A0A316APX9_9BACT|nr:carboxymuconolactone decarboxylase family protein [Dyadobacter jejuensis]PWJ59541.1 putative peroxidase-related enzyme [Dyadobacter jejuensis]
MKRPLVFPKSDSEDQDLQELIAFYDETLGFCPNSVKTMHIRPRIAYAFIEMNKAVMENQGRVTSALKRLIGYVTSHVTGCRYCQAHTIRAAERYGASQDQLDQVWSYQSSSAFTEAEKAALDFAIASASVPNGVDDAIATNLRQYWDEGEIVEMLGVIALFGFLNRWNDSMGTEMEPGAVASGEALLAKDGWSVGKHQYE